MKKKIISCIGPSAPNCSNEVYEFGIQLGYRLASAGYLIVQGGRDGFMEAVCKGARKATTGQFVTIGILPGFNHSEANAWCDVVLPTGIGYARNQMTVLAADIVLAVAGGPGTMSEITYAMQFKKQTLCCTQFPGSAAFMAHEKEQLSFGDYLIPVNHLKDIMITLKTLLR